MKKIPFFLPFGACRERCVYCDQAAITGHSAPPSPDAVRAALKNLTEPYEVCFFGGSFCRFDRETVKSYLDAVRDDAPHGSRIRFSTYPGDLEDPEMLSLVLQYNIACVELGIPSLDRNVLAACRRDADPETILNNLRTLRNASLPIGVQVMIGLPGQTQESTLRDLQTLAKVKGPQGWDVRIYPCLVIAGTELDSMTRNGNAYVPLSLEAAVKWGGALLVKARDLGFRPIRIGLQDSVSLRETVRGGPYHPALGELIFSEALACTLARNSKTGPWAIPKGDLSKLTGHGNFGLRRLSELAGVDLAQTKNLLTLF